MSIDIVSGIETRNFQNIQYLKKMIFTKFRVFQTLYNHCFSSLNLSHIATYKILALTGSFFTLKSL